MNQRLFIQQAECSHRFGCQISALTHKLVASHEAAGDSELPALLKPGIALANELPQPGETPVVEPGKKPLIVDPPAPNPPSPGIPPQPLPEPTLPVPDVAPFE
jgi:hypothetical protein